MKGITGPTPDMDTHLSCLPRASLNRLIGRALLDPSFCSRLLNGSRAEILDDSQWGLTADERSALLAIKANTLFDFARAIDLRFPA